MKYVGGFATALLLTMATGRAMATEVCVTPGVIPAGHTWITVAKNTNCPSGDCWKSQKIVLHANKWVDGKAMRCGDGPKLTEGASYCVRKVWATVRGQRLVFKK
jgi:hypothetical protein